MSAQDEQSRNYFLLITESPGQNEINAALAKASIGIANARANQKNSYFNSDYADLAAVRDAITKPLAENGLCITQTLGQFMSKRYLVTTLRHESGQFIRSLASLEDCENDQKFGTHLTYMRRYTLKAIVNIDQYDDDGEATSDTVITDEQAETISRLVRKHDVDVKKFKIWLQASIGVDEIEKIPQRRLTEVVTAIESRPLKQSDPAAA